MNSTEHLQEIEPQLLIICNISGNLMGIPTGSVQEVLAIPEIRPVHHAPPYITGVFNLRGRVIVLVDPAVKLDLPAQEPAGESRILVIQSGQELIGLLVDGLLGIVPFSPDQQTPNPENLQKAFRKVISGYCFLNGQTVGLVKIPELLEKTEEMGLEGNHPE
jgi:purine-binding chemotaxis protein CheW